MKLEREIHNEISIYKYDELDIYECESVNTSENGDYNSSDIENIQNKIAKRLITLTQDEHIKWKIDDDIFRHEYVKLSGIGIKDKPLNFKYSLYIHRKSLAKSYFLYTAKNMQNDWEMLYPCSYDGVCTHPEQEIFIKEMLNILEEKKILAWIKGDL